MNKGEWGEPYVALRLLGDRKLCIADENGNIKRDEWMDILKITRKETNERTVTYYCSESDAFVDIEINGIPVASIPSERFFQMSECLKNDILQSSGRSFNVSGEVVDFLGQAEIKHMKAKSVEKSDIVLDARDPRTSIIRHDIGFSIKSEFGKDPTLFNTGRASAAKYRISGMLPGLMEKVNSLLDSKGHAAVADRCALLKAAGCKLEFVGYEMASRAKCKAFEENLDQINPRLPYVIERIVWNHFMEGYSEVDIPTVTQRIIDENPCNISRPDDKYTYMMKMFLYSAYCGMTAGTVWDGKNTVKGGYITVKDSGEIVANYAMEAEEFKIFLYTHCYLDFPSTDRGHGDYGAVVYEDGEYYFKFNFQVRIR